MNSQTQRERRRLHFRQESFLRRSLAVPDDRGTALCFSEDNGATRTAIPETRDFARSRSSASPNRRLFILTATTAVQPARHFSPLSRVGRRIERDEERGVRSLAHSGLYRPIPRPPLNNG